MDYDDTDFQSQNFQLAGEDNSKFTSGLRLFALPKLNIDDQLQGHLRFDNIIDSEGFFSVQGHDNSWIEVLSTGSSVVDFSSSAAESCTISRTNNVWSEATSTESVEMLLKSVGENEMTGNMDGNAHHQLSGMDSQIDPSNMQPKSSNSPTGSIVVPTENDQSQSTLSRMTEDPSWTQPQLEHIAPLSMDEKAEQAVGSTLSDRKSNFMLESVAEKCIVSEKLSSASKNTSESCPAVDNYFEVVHDDDSLDNHNVHSAGVDSEPFSELAPLQNIYTTDSYHFDQDNQESGVGVTPQDSEIRHMNENKVEGGLHELQNLSCTSQPLGTTNLSGEVSNENLLSESSDGLLEAITNPVKMLHRNDDTFQRASASQQPSFSQVEHAAEGLKSSVDSGSELVVKEVDTGEEPTSAKSHQSEPDSRNSNPHLVTPLSTESGELIQSPKGKQLAHVTGVPEETKNAGVDDTNISSGDDPKLGLLEQHQDSVDNLKSGVMEEKTTRDTEHMVKSGYDENATGATDTSKDKFDSSGNITPDNSSACLLDEKDPNISSVNHEGSFKEGATPTLEDEPGKQHLVSPNSGPQEEKSVRLNISSSNVVSTTVTDTSDTSKDKLESSGGVAPNDSSTGLLDEKDLRISSINYEGSFKEGGKSALEVGGHNDTSPVSEPRGKKPAVLVNSSINTVCSSGTDAVATKTQCKEQDTSLGSLTTSETQDKSGFDFRTDSVGIHSGDHPDAYQQKCQTDGPLIQSEHHEDLVAPSSTLSVSPDNAVQKIVETPLNAKDDLDAHLQDKALNPGADHTPSTVSSQSMVGLEPGNGDGSCTDATCGSPTVISCTEPCPQEDGQAGSALLHHTLTEQSEDPKDPAASADAAQSSQECSARDGKPTLSSGETNTAGDDRSFSFEVGAPPNVSEKAQSPAWSPFPRSKAAQSTEATTEILIPGNPSSPLKNTSDDSKEISIVETGKEQLSGRKVIKSSGGPSIASHIGDSTKTRNAPPEQSQQHPTPESPALVHQPFTDLQHVQLRAQIFVYGALIQGIPPAEAYMVSAFGEPGGGKPAWEAIWRAAVERFQNQKAPLIGLETPPSSRIGSRVAEKTSKGTAVKTAPASKKGGKTVLAAHSAVPLHSPTFNMSPLGSSTLNLQRGTHLNFSQAVSPVFTYNSQMRQPTSGVASWFPESPGPRPAPWLVPPQNLIFDSSMQPVVPTNETAKGAPSKNISMSQAVSPDVFLPSQAPSTVSPPLTVAHEEKQKASASTSKRGATSQKSRKRKKVSASPEQQPGIVSPQLTKDMESVTATKQMASVTATKQTPSFTLSTHSPSNVLGSGLVPNTGLITSVPNYQITGSKDAEQRFIFSEQICVAIEQSLGHAKGASMHSMEALRHNESLWNNLSTNSRSKLPAEVEEKLTSAAAAASAAVSVAKAAAEAAKMASEAALQAKMMAEEALSSSKSVIPLQKCDTGEFVANSNPASVSGLTPTSSWKIKDNTHAPGSIISVAREVARKRVEEAAAAAKRAENLDAILKVAELAAEAVFKAGTIIGMGEPLPFTLGELLEAGPDGYWKSDRVSNKKVGNAKNNPVKEQLEGPTDFGKSGRKRGSKAKYDKAIQNLEPSSSGKELQPDGMKSGNGVEDVPTTAPLNGNINDAAPSIIWNGIEKGSLVEVLADEGGFGGAGFGGAWFSAKVLDINEDSACISYETSEGTGLRKKWVPLKQEGEKAPQIRLAHPATMSKFKGTRKRRRDMAGNYSWTIGDHVDAWIKDSWREGIISQNCDADETKFVVQFSAGGGDSSAVDAWNLRPSLVWNDGQWTEWSRVQERKAKSNKGDSPYEKRQRTAGSDPVPIGGEAGGPSMDKNTNNATKPEELKPLALSDRDMVFNIGKSVTENKTDGLAFKRPGLQKEGSRVVYGVPKPGKKKKFMEVSKHYVADQADKSSVVNASTRFAKNLIPRVPRPRESTSKVDQRGKRIGEMRSRGLKSTMSRNVASESVPGKDPLSMSVPSSGVFESSFAFAGSTAGSSITVNPTVEKNNSAHGTGLKTEDASVSELHIQAASTVHTSKKNLTTTDRAKRKYVPSKDNLNRNIPKTSEIAGKTSSDSSEPRRSNRRIQPTSRLLEGLQSSLIASKVPGEKGPRTNYRSASSRGRAHG